MQAALAALSFRTLLLHLISGYCQNMMRLPYVESSAVKLLEEWGIDCGGQVLDPTLLLDSSQWSEYIEEDVKKSMY